MLFIVSGFTSGKAAGPGSVRADGNAPLKEPGHIMEGMEAEDISPVSEDAAEDRSEISALDDQAVFARFCEAYELTQREAEIMQMILKSDLPTTQLSGELHVSERTLYRHLSALYQKTGTDSRVGLLMKYYEQRDK